MEPVQENYYSYNQYLHKTFGAKTYKIVVASGLTCPTRDGTIAKRGCSFCDIRGSSSFHGKKGRALDVQEQIRTRIPSIQARFHAQKFLAYFQSYTNTYADVDYLRPLYEAALAEPGVEGLCIGTRPDCLPDAVIALLEELAQKHYVSLELGVQSFEDKTLEFLTRGHDGQCSIDALKKLSRLAPHVHTCAHFMFGAPTDTQHAARDAALILNDLGVRGTKLHQLMVLDHTELADRYRAQPFPTVTLDEYGRIVIEFIEHLSPKIYLERLCANASHPEECLAPEWSRNRWEPHNRLREMMVDANLVQGSKVIARDRGTSGILAVRDSLALG